MSAPSAVPGQTTQLPTLSPAVASELLPAAASHDLELVPAEPIEVYQTWLLNQKEWRGPLTLDQYIGRERHALQQELTRENRLTGWLLTSPALPTTADGVRPILSSCETILKTGYVARGGQLEVVKAHGIASVYTRPEYRGRGYAARMMVELAKKLETFQQDDGVPGTFSVLYSDIGSKFYSRFGWKVFPSTHVHLEPIDDQRYQELRPRVRQVVKKGLPEVHDLYAEDLKDIPASAYLETELRAISAADPQLPYIAMRPDLDHFQWHHAREEFQSQTIGRSLPTIKGAIHKDSGIAVIWARVYASNPKDYSLHVLHVAIPPPLKAGPTADDHLALSALLLRAQKEAFDWDMHAGVEVWDPSGFVITAAQKLRLAEEGNVEVIRRDKEHLCSLKFIGVKPEDEAGRDIVWSHNEKYAWC